MHLPLEETHHLGCLLTCHTQGPLCQDSPCCLLVLPWGSHQCHLLGGSRSCRCQLTQDSKGPGMSPCHTPSPAWKVKHHHRCFWLLPFARHQGPVQGHVWRLWEQERLLLMAWGVAPTSNGSRSSCPLRQLPGMIRSKIWNLNCQKPLRRPPWLWWKPQSTWSLWDKGSPQAGWHWWNLPNGDPRLPQPQAHLGAGQHPPNRVQTESKQSPEEAVQSNTAQHFQWLLSSLSWGNGVEAHMWTCRLLQRC